MSGLFRGLESFRVNLGDVSLQGKHGGSGPPVLLLHGFPQMHYHWHDLAPRLAERYTVIAPDLPGYGDSCRLVAEASPDLASKRQMGEQMLRLMAQFGHGAFFLAGHDRGARVAYRLTLDHPNAVKALFSFDTVPTLDIWEAMDWTAAVDAFHWPLLAQPSPVPETLIGANPKFFLEHLIERWIGTEGALLPEALEHYAKAMANPDVIQGMCDDYRAGATVDVEHDRIDRHNGTRIDCPVLAIRGADYQPEPLKPIWDNWANDVTEVDLDCGHFIAEERPAECAELMQNFFGKIHVPT